MSDTPIDPQPTDPPTNTGGGGGTSPGEPEEDVALLDTDPPVNTGGGGGS